MKNSGGINITVSGKADVGSIIQGDNNTVSQRNFKKIQESMFAPAMNEIEEEGHKSGIPQKEIEKLKNEIEVIMQNHQEKDVLISLKELYEKFSWAIEPLGKLYKVLANYF